MKRIISFLILFFMTVSLIAPIYCKSTSKEEEKVKVDTSNVKLNAGVSNIIFADIDAEKWKVGWADREVYVYRKPDVSSEILDTYDFNEVIVYQILNEEWVMVSVCGMDGYILPYDISDREYKYEEHILPNNSGFKSYMPYTTITNKSSSQYKLQQQATTGRYGIRTIDGYRYCVAIGTAFKAEIGTYFDLILENGVVIPCIVGDIKADEHTESNNIITSNNGCLSEFIIDGTELKREVKRDGDVSSCLDSWNSPAFKIKIYEKTFFEEDAK